MSSHSLPEFQAFQATVPPLPTLSITGRTLPSVVATVVVLSVFLTISIVLVIVHIIVRLTRVHCVYLNDYLLVLGSLFTTIEAVCTIAILCQGLAGHHLVEILEIVPNRWVVSMKLGLASQFCWAIGIVFIKLSILHLYVQLFGSYKRLVWAAGILAFIVTLLGVISVALVATNGKPFSAYWMFNGHCVNQSPSFLGTAIMNLIMDVLILALPMPKLWDLTMPTGKKVGLTFIFGIGFGICGISAWRIKVITDFNFDDFTYRVQYLGASTSLELLLGVIITCIPIIRPALEHLLLSFQSLKSRFVSRIRCRRINNASSTDLSGIVPNKISSAFSKSKTSESQLDRRNFKKLYNHLYPMTNLSTGNKLTVCVSMDPGNTISKRDEDRQTGNIEITREWNVLYLADQVEA